MDMNEATRLAIRAELGFSDEEVILEALRYFARHERDMERTAPEHFKIGHGYMAHRAIQILEVINPKRAQH